ncbi:hypothetical protein [Vibrio sp.]|uniref:hypothetical protein n=1 Tax=Vibrio sp. TaxID=678 RepID=UPI003D0EE5AD
MKRRLLPVPLILLIPIVLLLLVVVTAVYRFSLDDEQILAKYPASTQTSDPIVKQLFGISTTNPWTIQVPQSKAFALIDETDTEHQRVFGSYDDGVERGTVSVLTDTIRPLDPQRSVAIMVVSNQGSGAFYYLSLFRFDDSVKRIVLADSQLLGDRIAIEQLTTDGNQIQIRYKKHGPDQAYSEEPELMEAAQYSVAPDNQLR